MNGGHDQTRQAGMKPGEGIWRALCLSLATGIVSIAILEVLARADGVLATTRAQWGWSFLFVSIVSAIPAGVIGVAATQLQGSYARRLAKLSALAIAFCLLGAISLGVLLSFAPGNDPHALPLAPHFWEILSVSLCVPALGGVAVLARWIAPGERPWPYEAEKKIVGS